MNTKNLTVKICSSWMGMWVPNLFFFFMGIRTLKLQGVPQKVKFIIFLNDVFFGFWGRDLPGGESLSIQQAHFPQQCCGN